MLITESYREQNKKLHETSEFGVSGWKWAKAVSELADQLGINTILDYGCGRQTLKANVPHLNVIGYDPAIEGLDEIPSPTDFVVCTDVLEHIEPECLNAVLDDLQRVTLKVGFFVVATRPAKKILPDGRNAHLIQQPLHWWIEKLSDKFKINFIQNFGGEFLVLVNKK